MFTRCLMKDAVERYGVGRVVVASSHATFTFSLFFFSLLFFSSSSTARPPYFINCGSVENADLGDGRMFVGDVKPRNFAFSGPGSNTLKNSNQSAAPLYQTARVFQHPSIFGLKIIQNGTYFLRLHFYPFSSFPELANARFNVSASGYLLLSNFTVDKNNSNFSPVKEFYIRLNTPILRIHFVPQTGSIAFVNAIEVLSASLSITEDSGPYVSPEGNITDYKGPKSSVFETIYRIDVGGTNPIALGNDKLWRAWIPDDHFLLTKDALDSPPHDTGVSWPPGHPTLSDVSDVVYETAKQTTDRNYTWRFNVSKENWYFVRAHFCDIVSAALSMNEFNIYFYSKFAQVINPYVTSNNTLTAPFHEDFIVASNQRGFIDIGIGPKNNSTAFLNGLEILQMEEGGAPDPDIVEGGSSHLVLIVGLSIGGLIIIMVIFVVLVVHRRKRKTHDVDLFEGGMVPLNVGGSSYNRTPDSSTLRPPNLSNLQLGLKISLSVIQHATKNFDPNLIIGEGGFGKVYKGLLDGLNVAVKRSNSDHGQGIAEFQTEIMVLSKIRHYHLVSLIGYCYEQDEMILVYEFMEKGSLRDHLYDSSKVESLGSSARVGLSWKQRLEICIGAAKGLQYLHTGLDSGIIHRDVKSTNILLDHKFVAKVADFGLSRSQHFEKTHVSTEVKGTFGYLDPEYFTCLQLTEKSDVYSFGVLLFEILCARAVINRSLPREQINLVEWTKNCYGNGCLEKIIDPFVSAEISPNSLKRFVETGMKCLKESAMERPPMSDVLWDLEYALQLQKRSTPDDSVTDASMTVSMPFPVVRRFPSQSFADDEEEHSILVDTSTSGVFSQLSFEKDGGR